QRGEARVRLGAGRAAGEVGPKAGNEPVGVAAGELQLDVAVECREALVATELGIAWAEQAEQRELRGAVDVHDSPLSSSASKPRASRCARSFRRASCSVL